MFEYFKLARDSALRKSLELIAAVDRYNVKVNLIYSGHALSFTSTKLSQFTGMPLKQRKQIFQINLT